MKRKHILPLLKIIGICIFGWILYHIDRAQLWTALSKTNLPQLCLALLSMLGICLAKSMRWHVLVRATAMHPRFKESWRLYFIGIFLGNITPAKVGEFGRAAYLRKKGLPLKIGMLLALADRAADAAVIVLLGLIGLGMLGWPEWSLIIASLLILAGMIGALLLLQKRMVRLSLPLLRLFFRKARPHLIANVMLYTIIAWIFYFMWAVLLARSLHIGTDAHVLIASFTITGLFSMLPIAPSGLGTRDAALVFLLAPYGVVPETAVALAMLMFITILLMSVPGGWYWTRGTKES